MNESSENSQDTAAPSSPDQTVVFGPTGNAGEYITPYQMTIIYHDDNPFEVAVATLASRAQLIPILRPDVTGDSQSNTINYLSVADSCEFLSPEVLIFGADFPREAVQKFFDRGFQFVHIFVSNEEDAKKYIEFEDATVDTSTTDDNAGRECQQSTKWKYFNDSVVTFGIDALYEHINLTEGLATMIALEHVITGVFPKYKSFNEKITADDGHCFLRYLKDSKKDLRKTLLMLISSYRGFETIDQMVISGRAMIEECEILANRRLDNSITYQISITNTADTCKKYVDEELATREYITARACYGGDLMNEMMHLAPAHPKFLDVNLVVFYTFNNTSTQSWNITIFSHRGQINAVEFLRALTGVDVKGGYNIATCVLNDPAKIQIILGRS